MENKPELYDWMVEYVNAFRLLNKTRSCGMQANPITLTEILAYLQIYGTSDTEAFVYYVTEMDASFLEVMTSEKTGPIDDGSKSRTSRGR